MLKYAAVGVGIVVLLSVALLIWRQATYMPTCTETSSQSAMQTFTTQHAPEEIATILEGVEVVPRGYSLTPVPARTPSLNDAVLHYVSTPEVMRRYLHRVPCPIPVSTYP